jgi:hypothetical protein
LPTQLGHADPRPPTDDHLNRYALTDLGVADAREPFGAPGDPAS